ncbi:hypothetical protein Rhe02_86930 [Rhizocola hellebori]|uniref:DUF11 domain-containing protein n=1 Tax=Rhizocola hellebori TaxID=1392758 RepID=A0A8J3QK60_9ACTN|nr:hypothetical protein [Rhizocola hellebori]GIH10626.1 hypothetical protein Rhe02_86930 [Rhizocola hellebori]
MRPKSKVGTWARMLAVCALGVLTTGVFAEPAFGATATAQGLTNFGLAIGEGSGAPSKAKDFDVTFSGAADASIEFRNEKSDGSGNVIAGTSPVTWNFRGEGDPCDTQADGFCHLFEGVNEQEIDVRFRAASTVEAFAKFTVVLRDGTTVLNSTSIIISVLDGPDVGSVFPQTVYDESCPLVDEIKEGPCAVGDKIDFTVTARNVGAEPIVGVRVRLEFSSGIEPARDGSGNPIDGCVYTKGASTHITVVVCELPDVTMLRTDTKPFEFDLSSGADGTITGDAFGDEEVCFEVTSLKDTQLVYPTSGPCQLGNVGVLSGAAALKQIEDIDPQDNWGFVAIQNVATQVFDLAAIGDNVSGGIGDEVSAKVGIANRGTGAIDTYRTKQPASRITVKIPTGIQVQTAPPGCTKQTSFWLCSQPGSFLGAGQSFIFTFKLKIVSSSPDGEVSVREPGVDTRDGNAANDQAGLRVGSSGIGGGLPVTGLPVLTVAIIGTALLIVGIMVYHFTRRRRPESL